MLEVRTESGFDVKLDPAPLDALDELRCVLAGGRTYSRRWVRGEVYSRGAYKIRHEPAGTNPFVVVHAEHRCTPPPLPDLPPPGTPTPATTPHPGGEQ